MKPNLFSLRHPTDVRWSPSNLQSALCWQLYVQILVVAGGVGLSDKFNLAFRVGTPTFSLVQSLGGPKGSHTGS
jgi:hypothetical protein